MTKNRISIEEYKEYLRTGKLPGDPAPSKYKNKKTNYNNKVYPSQREANRAAELITMLRVKAIFQVFEQVEFNLPGGIKYIADFVILWPDGTYTVEDAKGYATKEYKLKRKLMNDVYGIEIREV